MSEYKDTQEDVLLDSQAELRATPAPETVPLEELVDQKAASQSLVGIGRDLEGSSGGPLAGSHASKPTDSVSRISPSNSLHKQIESYKKKKGVVEGADGKLAPDVAEVESFDSQRARELKEIDERVEKRLARMKKLQQFDLEWMDIQTNVQMVLDTNFEPYAEKQKDMELLLIFHDRVMRKQCTVLEALQQAVFMSADVDFSALYQVWDEEKKLPTEDEDDGEEVEEADPDRVAKDEGVEEDAEPQRVRAKDGLGDQEDGELARDEENEEDQRQTKILEPVEAAKSEMKKIVERRVEEMENDLAKLKRDSANAVDVAAGSENMPPRVAIGSNDSKPVGTVHVPKLGTGAGRKNDQQRRPEPQQSSRRGKDSSGKPTGGGSSQPKNIFDALFERLRRIEDDAQATERRLGRKIEHLELRAQNLGETQESIRLEQKHLEAYQQKLQKELNDMEKRNQGFQQKTKEQIDRFNESVLDQTQAMREDVGAVQLKITHQISKNHDFEMAFNGLDERMKKLSTQAQEMNKWVHCLEEVQRDSKVLFDTEKNIQEAMDKVKADLDKKESTLQCLERYIDVFMPIKIQAMLSETMGAVLNRQNLNKLEAYEQDKYKQLNDGLLSEDARSVLENMKILSQDLVDYTQKFTLFSKKASQKHKLLPKQQMPKPEKASQQQASGGDRLPKSGGPEIQVENQRVHGTQNIDGRRMPGEKVYEVGAGKAQAQQSKSASAWQVKQGTEPGALDSQPSEGDGSELFADAASRRDSSLREKVLFDSLKNLTAEQQEEKRRTVEYLMGLDLSENVDMIALSQLNFELSEREDDVLLKTGKNTIFKILKVVIYHLGLMQGKVAYEMKQIDQNMDAKFAKHKDEIKVFVDGLQDFKDASLFEMQQFQTKIAAVNASVGLARQKQDERLGLLREDFEELRNSQDQINHFHNEYMRIQNFIDRQQIEGRGTSASFSLFAGRQGRHSGVLATEADENALAGFPSVSQVHMSPKIQKQPSTFVRQGPQASEAPRNFENMGAPLNYLMQGVSPEQYQQPMNAANTLSGPHLLESISPRDASQPLAASPRAIQGQIGAFKTRNRKNIDISHIQQKEQPTESTMSPRDGMNSPKMAPSPNVMDQIEQVVKLGEGQANEAGARQEAAAGTGPPTRNSKIEDRTSTQLIEDRREAKALLSKAKGLGVSLQQRDQGAQAKRMVRYRAHDLPIEDLVGMQILLCDKIEQILNEQERPLGKQAPSGHEIFCDLYEYFMFNLRRSNSLAQEALHSQCLRNKSVAESQPQLDRQQRKFSTRNHSIAPARNGPANAKSAAALYGNLATRGQDDSLSNSFHALSAVKMGVEGFQNQEKSAQQVHSRWKAAQSGKQLNWQTTSVAVGSDGSRVTSNMQSQRTNQKMKRTMGSSASQKMVLNQEVLGPTQGSEDLSKLVVAADQLRNSGGLFPNLASSTYYPAGAPSSNYDTLPRVQKHHQWIYPSKAKMPLKNGKSAERAGKNQDSKLSYNSTYNRYPQVSAQKMSIRMYGKTKELRLAPSQVFMLAKGAGGSSSHANAVERGPLKASHNSRTIQPKDHSIMVPPRLEQDPLRSGHCQETTLRHDPESMGKASNSLVSDQQFGNAFPAAAQTRIAAVQTDLDQVPPPDQEHALSESNKQGSASPLARPPGRPGRGQAPLNPQHT